MLVGEAGVAGYVHFAYEFAVLHPGEIIRREAALRHRGKTTNSRIILLAIQLHLLLCVSALCDMVRPVQTTTTNGLRKNRITQKTRLRIVRGQLDVDAIILDDEEERNKVLASQGVDAEDANVRPVSRCSYVLTCDWLTEFEF